MKYLLDSNKVRLHRCLRQQKHFPWPGTSHQRPGSRTHQHISLLGNSRLELRGGVLPRFFSFHTFSYHSHYTLFPISCQAQRIRNSQLPDPTPSKIPATPTHPSKIPATRPHTFENRKSTRPAGRWLSAISYRYRGDSHHIVSHKEKKKCHCEPKRPGFSREKTRHFWSFVGIADGGVAKWRASPS